MHTLAFSISFSVLVSVFLKLARRWEVDPAQAIASGYVAAAGLCFVLLRPDLTGLFEQPTMGWAVLGALGVLLPSVFIIMARAVDLAGIVKSDAAQRLSLVIPLLAAFFIFQEPLSAKKFGGVALAMGALVCLIRRREGGAQTGTGGGSRMVAALLGVWVGYGVIDILFKLMARMGAGFSSSLFVSFLLALVLIFAWLALFQKTGWSRRSLVAGLGLGALNFGNIYFYIRAHQVFPEQPTLVFAAMNMGVISLGALVGAGIFKERLSPINIAGLAMAIGAIALLLPG